MQVLDEEQDKLIKQCEKQKSQEQVLSRPTEIENMDLNEQIVIDDEDTLNIGKNQGNEKGKMMPQKCPICSEQYESMLESHIIMMHNKVKEYKCNDCEAMFFFERRLRKHMTVHQDAKKRKCHYFNNGLTCPFYKDGCKFVHKVSDECKFKNACKQTKCQYRHRQGYN